MRAIHFPDFLACILFALLATHATQAPGQQTPASFSLLTDRQPIASLAGQWRFHPGDDPSFASPSFDDSAWPLLRSDQPWGTQGYPRMSGFAWYRFRIVLPPGKEPFSLLLPPIVTSWQCFVDGRLAASAGRLPPTRILYDSAAVVIPLPSEPRPATRTLTVALRVWHSPLWVNYVDGGPEQGAGDIERVGPAHDIALIFRQNLRSERQADSAKLDLAALDMLAGLTSLALFFLRRSEREYLWFGIAVLAPAVTLLAFYASLGKPLNVDFIDGLELLTRDISRLAYLAFFGRLLGTRTTSFLRFAVVCLFLNVIPLVLLEGFGVLSVGTASLLGTLCGLPFEIWVVAVLVRGWRRGVTDARLLLIPVLLVFGLNLLYDLLNISATFNHPVHFDLNDYAITYPFRIIPTDLAAGVFLLAMLAILVNRFARTSRQGDRNAAELEAARSLQQVLIPDILPTIPGLHIATAYHPAQEVGGDFFQILPLPDGDTLIVLGDVSGKGLPAAMTVSLAVGAIRTLVDYTDSPAAILNSLNRRLFGRGAGFTTCLALRFARDRTLTLANAGHLAPYRNGAEIPTPPALPLGLDPDVVYPEQTIRLQLNDHLTILTDGVPEATSRRELFGFLRTENLSSQSAPFIADAARSFGQSDDITVLTIDIRPFPPHLAPA